MKYYGKITDPKDFITKEYADQKVPNIGKGINLLRNWYFVGGGSQQGGRQFPINERGLTSYSGAVYGIDGWRGTNPNNISTLTSNGYQLSGLNGANVWEQQDVNNSDIFGKKMTVTALMANGVLVTATGELPVAAVSVNTGFAAQYIGVYKRPDGRGFGQLANTTGSPITFAAVKLELGDTQTLAHQENGVWVLNDPAPDFEEELIKCQTSHADRYDTYANKSFATGNLIGKVLGNPAGQNVAVGEFAIVNNELYVCDTAITSSMTPSTYMSYLTQKSGGGLNDLKAALPYIGIVEYTGSTGKLPLVCYRVGSMVILQAQYISPSETISAGSYELLGVVSENLRPSSGRWTGTVLSSSSGTFYGLRGSVAPDGTLYFVADKSIPTSEGLFGTLIYFL